MSAPRRFDDAESSSDSAGVTNEAACLMAAVGAVGSDEELIKVFATAIRAARMADLSVLIVGETGTGKELLARAVHRADPARRDGPFVSVNCASITAELYASEMFGFRRGSFTGAVSDRDGVLRASSGGVLFLDELAHLKPEVQAGLLRALQERRVRRLGESHERSVDLRIVAATNEEPSRLVGEGRLRPDLYYRLLGVTLELPPLRRRPTDIPSLVRHFLRVHSKQVDPGSRWRATPEFVKALSGAPLPGNVRELEHALLHAMIQALGDPTSRKGRSRSLCERHLPAPSLGLNPGGCDASIVRGGTGDPHALGEAFAIGALDEELSLRAASRVCEQALLAEALRRAAGSQTVAARTLGVTPRTVYNLLKKHDLA